MGDRSRINSKKSQAQSVQDGIPTEDRGNELMQLYEKSGLVKLIGVIRRLSLWA